MSDAAAAMEVAVAPYEPELSGTPDDPLVDRDGAEPARLLGGALPEIVDDAALRPVAFVAEDSWPETPVEIPCEAPLVIPPEAAPFAFVKEADTEAEADDIPAEATEVVPFPKLVIPLDDAPVTVGEVKLEAVERELTPVIVPVATTELDWAEVIGWAAPDDSTSPEDEDEAGPTAVETIDDVLALIPLEVTLAIEVTPEIAVLVFDTTAELAGPEVALATELFPADWE